ncbi:MAG: UDP-N-acetylmuramoyl-L-alanyl-D-glutamate--2,6-diaminopimelate ligase [Bacteroidales bacterium]|nr:UDP-N-acetylmuramoyl-L-alanyl-D-glutamate--2,6-diaminopimelate ligase [Bacteroidales bacterium]MBQ7490097.1 UDP-N-acetylmuramoyl-L-alanyl-D-glutamate--2,6-diaminopimelate ligase [Bacteroidales bacterium]
MKTLESLLAVLEKYEIRGSEKETFVSGIEFDTRKIAPAADGAPLYVAQRGTQVDGHAFIPQAVAAGAGCIVCEEFPQELSDNVTYIKVSDSATALGKLASAFYGFPSKSLKLVGITGTNGKTTTVTLLHRLFTKMGYMAGMLSTIVNRIGEREIPATHTTPDAVQLNKLLAEMVAAGCEYCFMEVSSHSICQGRIAGLHFTGGIFSNITHDHLDFHKTFANYIAAKKMFFDMLPPTAFALTNADDRNGLVMTQNTKAKVSTYSLQTAATFKGRITDNSFEGLQMEINRKEVFFKLCGKFNAYNLLAIYGTAILLGASEDEVLQTMSGLDSATGRFQIYRNDKGCTAIIDYAHTPDALKNVLSTIKEITENSAEIITVVGCGGDRDALKRPIMAETACQYSNKVILTSDNPRTEDPNAILAEMEKGVPVAFRQNVLVIENRHEAIKAGCMMLTAGGVLLVAGKGHETYQEINHVRHHFNDMEEVIKNWTPQTK